MKEFVFFSVEKSIVDTGIICSSRYCINLDPVINIYAPHNDLIKCNGIYPMFFREIWRNVGIMIFRCKVLSSLQ